MRGKLILVLAILGTLPLARQARGDESIPVDVLKAIKKATVYVKVKVEGEECSGSGFVVMRDDGVAYVITNHHVIAPELVEIVAQWQSGPRPRRAVRAVATADTARGTPLLRLLRRSVRPPTPGRVWCRVWWSARQKMSNVTVVFQSGTSDEQAVKAAILAADPDIDLAILKVSGVKNVPQPIGCKQAVDCAETMPVYSFGFPFGDVLATGKGNPAVTVGKATISSLPTMMRANLPWCRSTGR